MSDTEQDTTNQQNEDDSGLVSAEIESYASPDPDNVDACRSVWYIGGDDPRKASTLMPGARDDQVRIQFLDDGIKRKVPVSDIRRRNTWTDEPMKPVGTV